MEPVIFDNPVRIKLKKKYLINVGMRNKTNFSKRAGSGGSSPRGRMRNNIRKPEMMN